MAHLVHVSHEFDLSRYGSVDIAWDDDEGADSISDITSGIYRHATSAADSLTHPGGGAAIANTAHGCFADALTLLIGARHAVPDLLVVTYSNTTNRYTIAAKPGAGAFTVTWSGAAQLRMRKLLGFTGNLSGATSYTATLPPYYSIEPRIPGLVAWSDVRAIADSVPIRITSSGDTSGPVGPARTPWTAHVEFAQETDAQTLSQYVVDPAYCWQDFWLEAGRYGRLCYLVDASPPVGGDVRWAFRLNKTAFDESTHRRERAELRARWRIVVEAVLRGRF